MLPSLHLLSLGASWRSYTHHYNEHRPHRALEQRPPAAKAPPIIDHRASGEVLLLARVRRRDRLGDLIHEYHLAA